MAGTQGRSDGYVNAQQLARLLNCAFDMWAVTARAAARDAAALTVDVHGPDDHSWQVKRETGDGHGFDGAYWTVTALRYGDPTRNGDEAPTRLRSIAGVQLELRRSLQPGFAPGRALIGVRPEAVAR